MLVSRSRCALVCFLALVASCSAWNDTDVAAPKFKILAIFGHMGKSHFDVFKPLLEELARRGHELTVASHFPRTQKAIAAEPLPNYKDVSLVDEKVQVFVNVVDLRNMTDSVFNVVKNLYSLYMMGDLSCDIGLRNTELKKVVESEKFDLVLTENFNTNCFMPVVHKTGAPFVQISTHQLMDWAVEHLAASHEASYVPAMFSHLPKPMNFLQRTWNVLLISFVTTVYDTLYNWRDQSMAEKYYGPGIPNVKEISKNVSLMLLNTHYSLHGAQHFPRNVIEVGGLHIPSKPNPLPKDIKKFLDEAHEGVLYFNLGSMVKMATVQEDKLNVLLNVLTSIPRKVIWKWETDELPLKSKNVLVKKWLPQFDILSHPNVKCYFGHGGLLGLSEGTYNGVPMILMPLYGDQYQNSMAAAARGVAQVLKYVELSEQSLRHALDEIFNNTRYMENAKALSKAYRDRSSTPMETAVWWVEHIARSKGGPYLRSQAADMSWWTRNLVDVIAFLVAVPLLVLYLILSNVSSSRRRRDRRDSKRASTKKRN
ncbi:UDP-glycosyltransferase UGT5 [Colletes latitarsis]|uniref:UDP-glycosyltransferase UGT5 n=1 Tax=Colletes latitarsis TaxID=2605962 RepID=UPI00403683CA